MYNLTTNRYEYHYEVVGFCPRTDIDMGRWAFGIRLSSSYAALLKDVPINQKRFDNLHARCHEVLLAVQGRDYLDLFHRSYPHLQFWEDTCLLTNISVPGNACGLDMEWGTFNELGKRDREHAVEYLPHNIDSMAQAVSLLAVWTTWYDLSNVLREACIKDALTICSKCGKPSEGCPLCQNCETEPGLM